MPTTKADELHPEWMATVEQLSADERRAMSLFVDAVLSVDKPREIDSAWLSDVAAQVPHLLDRAAMGIVRTSARRGAVATVRETERVLARFPGGLRPGAMEVRFE